MSDPKPDTPLPTLDQRSTGVLLHITSLDGHYGIGDLGRPARHLVHWLKAAGVSWWQVLPITPPSAENSPYESISAFAGWHALISLEDLVADGLLPKKALADIPKLPEDRADYQAAQDIRTRLLRQAHQSFTPSDDYHDFLKNQADWLDDWALHEAIRNTRNGKPWHTWPDDLRLRHKHHIETARHDLADDIDFHKFVQYVFDKQWNALREICRDAGIGLIGDVPIFVGMDAADVWAHRALFDLDRDGRPKAISGVPPDMFSETGQVWDHPLYNWTNHEKTDYAWWAARMRHTLNQFDAVRIDHFLGFLRCWAIPADTRHAPDGKWRKGPAKSFFDAVEQQLGTMAVIAEDLGDVTQQAIDLRDDLGYPGMMVTQFGFGEDHAHHAPHNHPRNCVAYTGTHDNNTLSGFYHESSSETRKRILLYTGKEADSVAEDLTRITLLSQANIAVIPPQDLLGLDTHHRMNIPGKKVGNWTWRLPPGSLTASHAKKIHRLNLLAGRTQPLPATES
ncbi:4-alpha-glucanotransferase [Mucisphaera calidilacus]|uniref:4-alpha-glucanotransferase n=1 Tax=Mucisphaera calidilacus TaxID=2527982 RepID=A0A518C031_9BACT|nr:4-alpha-glucanotransferase [Mucisphaera calidilacus]QDU72575.1 4-alpha-glucanotransferase [Mucisphaera calidilacus]